jgi:hypothetical protein
MDVIDSNRDRWIPILARLLDSGDRTTHDNAALTLLEIGNGDAVRLLLPWIADPHWADGPADARDTLMMLVGAAKVIDAVPMLIAALCRGDRAGEAAYALMTMEVRVDRSLLLNALHRSTDPEQRGTLAYAIVVGDDLSPNELAAAIEASLLDRKNDAAAIGAAAVTIESEDVAAAVLKRAAAAEPPTAAKLRDAIVSWSVPSSDREKLRRIVNGTADVNMIVSLLTRRNEIRETLRLDLSRIDRGIARGIAAAITGDRLESTKILRGDDVDAERALLAGARLTREPLPPSEVTRLYSRSAALDRTIDAWLGRPVR